MIRCPRCGLRLHEERPSCPSHGVPVAGSNRSSSHSSALWPRPTTPDPSLISALEAEGYRILGVLGQGGFGTVYRAERMRDRLTAAIKVTFPEHLDAQNSLGREADALQLVGPPHVPAVYRRGKILDRYYVALEFIAAPTLADRLIAEAGPMIPLRFAGAADAILRALEAIHARGLVHLDLKPENIFLTDDGEAKIIDFGLAKEQTAQPEIVEVTTAAIIGTSEYMSPEQCDGLSDADRRSDIYSVGALLYEMLSGAPPFWGQSADVREAQRSRRPAPLVQKVNCSIELDQVIRRCLAKDRQRRFEDVESLRQALHSALRVRRPSLKPSIKPVPTQTGLQASTQATIGLGVAREKRTVGLLFFESKAGVGNVQPVVTTSGGQIVQTNGSQYVAAFAHDVGDNPARIALVAAHRLLAAKLTERLLVDIASVSVQVRPDGSRRVFSPVFARKDRVPVPADPVGVMLTGAAIEVIPDLNTTPVNGRPDRFALALTQPTQESTTSFGIQLAPLFGRDQIIRELLETARSALTGAEPTLVTVVGEQGHGRTHLAGTTAQRIELLLPKVTVIRLTARESIVGAVSQTLPELLRRILTLPAEAPPDGGEGLLRERLGSAPADHTWAAAAFTLGWIEADHPEIRPLAAAPGALRLASARAVGEALRIRAKHSPVALVLDDAHLADEVTLDAIEFASLKEAKAAIWACALVRPGFEHGRPNWATRAAVARKITLGPLEPADAAELAKRLLLPVEYVPPSALAKLVERTQGIPQLLMELVRGLKRDGLVRRSERGTGFYLAMEELDKLPDLPIVQWNASREIEALPSQLAGHARLASVLGSNFTVGEVESLLAILERDEVPEDMQLDASVGIQRLIDAGLLLRHRTGLIDFRHALLRETIYQLLPDAQRGKIHRAAYEMYLSGSLPEEHRLPRLALHAARSGQKAVAASAYLDLAARALSAHAYLEAENAYATALENLTSEDSRLIAALRGRGLMRSRLSRQEDALKDLRRAKELAQAAGALDREIDLLLDEATVLDWTTDYVASAELVRKARDLTTNPSRALSARLAMSFCRTYMREQKLEECVKAGEEAVALAESLGDAGYETRVIALMLMAPTCANLGKLREAEKYFDMAIAETRSHGDLLHLGSVTGNRCQLWFALKDSVRLFEDLRESRRIAREVGAPMLEYVHVCNTAEVEYAMGALEEATELTRQAYGLAQQLWGPVNIQVALRELLFARVALYRADLAQAASQTAKIRSQVVEARKATGEELLPSDQVLFEMVELGARNAPDPEWEELAQRARRIDLQPLEEVEMLEARALCAFRRGDADLSRSLFLRALAVSANKPNLLSDRVERKFGEVFGPRAA